MVLIVLDALRARNLGCYGYPDGSSPSIDALARDAVVFDQAISVGGNTPAALAALFTGRYSFYEPDQEAPFGMERFRAGPGGTGLPEAMTTLAEHLAAAGYETAGFVTNPYMKAEFRMQQGFRHYEEVFNEQGNLSAGARQLTNRALRYLRQVDWSRPTLLYLHYMDTHGPYKPGPPKTFADLQEQVSAMRTWVNLRDAKRADHEQLHRYVSFIYDRAIRLADGGIRRILDHYRQRGLMDETLVVVTADHGDEFLEHGATLHKGTLFEELVHVPLVVRAPDGARGIRRRELVRNFDVMPTILDYAGITGPQRHMEARSLRAALEGGPFDGPGEAFASFPWIQMLRTERYKLLRWAGGQEELYDLIGDPGEHNNLVSSRDGAVASERTALGRRLDQIVRALREQGSKPRAGPQPGIGEETRQQLKALGYID